MHELVKGSYKRTGLTETVLVISISVCTNSTPYSTVSKELFKKVFGLSRISVFVLSEVHMCVW